jgi:chorismate-pyruvate lyase
VTDLAANKSTLAAQPQWLALEECRAQVPIALLPWLAEPGLLTARARSEAGAAAGFRLLRLALAPIATDVQARLQITDRTGLLREIEFTCGEVRWIYALSVFPASTVREYPWLAELGGAALGEALARISEVVREPLEYLALPRGHALDIAARTQARAGADTDARRCWARRAAYRLGQHRILVTEVFLPSIEDRH